MTGNISHEDARELMHEALDGSEDAREALAAHLAKCEECAAEFAALQRLQAAVGETVACEPPPDRLERATAAALATSDEPRGHRWVAIFAMAAAVLLAFGIGLLAGREAFPREVVRVKHVPQVVEKVVEREVEVPVVEERVVVRRVEVPVYRERIVYRDRPVDVAEAEDRTAPPEPVMPEIREERIVAKPMPITITQTEEVMPAPIAGEEQPESDEVGAEPTPNEERLALHSAEPNTDQSVQ